MKTRDTFALIKSQQWDCILPHNMLESIQNTMKFFNQQLISPTS